MKKHPSYSKKIVKTLENGSEEVIYSFSMKTDIHNLFYLGSMSGTIILAFFLLVNNENLGGILLQMKIVMSFCIFCITIGLLFWKVEKRFIFSPQAGNLTLKTMRFRKKLYSKTFLIKDCQKFDIQFFPRKNTSYFVLQCNLAKPFRIQIKRKNDKINLHLMALNQMLSSIKLTHFPSSFSENYTNTTEGIKISDKNRKITRDADLNIVLSKKHLFLIFPMLFIIPLLLIYVSYLFFGTASSVGANSPTLVLSTSLVSVNYIGIVFFIFYAFRIENVEVKRDHEILCGDHLFTPPKFLQNFLNRLNAIYIKPEQMQFYRKLRTGFILEGLLPVVTNLVFFFL
jgi:hypothetical protein